MNTRTPADWKALFESDAFAQQNTYTGPLGVEYTPAGTRLRLWAPTARQVYVNLYRRGDGGVCIGSLPLEKRGQGLWSVYLPGDQHGRYYTYTLHAGDTSWEAADPYARAAGVNGKRSMIADFARIDPPGWLHDHRPNIPVSHRSVWEVNVRDFSQDPASGVRPAWRGKYLAFAQQGTTLHSDGIHPTCLNYLKRLGVSYVQLMPIFDFGSVDESRSLTRQYNWGYDPAHFNIPEGSYSTDPTRGEVRVRECKQMIAALHAAGIGVIMDVVYNHMYGNDNVLNRAVPYYYFRQNEDGSFSNGSGCGNEFASERPMARRYLIDSVLYWAREYHIDGFRFDLMGLYDVETMNLLRAELDQLPGGRNILMYGEPWQGGVSALHRYEANKNNLAMLNERIGIFCDNTRDAIKGGCDVIVTDGFSGNVMLKTIEGVGSFAGSALKTMFKKNLLTKLAALLVMPGLNEFKARLDPNKVGGTAFIGISRPVIKAHGGSNAEAIENAVGQAIQVAQSGITEAIAEHIDKMQFPTA